MVLKKGAKNGKKGKKPSKVSMADELVKKNKSEGKLTKKQVSPTPLPTPHSQTTNPLAQLAAKKKAQLEDAASHDFEKALKEKERGEINPHSPLTAHNIHLRKPPLLTHNNHQPSQPQRSEPPEAPTTSGCLRR